MDRAEQRALEKYPYAEICREKYIEGYHQAEKDLELGWEDIKKLRKLMSTKRINDGLFDKEDYEEVLERFNKERKEK